MKITIRVLSIALVVVGGIIALPAFFDWTHLIFSRNTTGGESIFTQFAIGGVLVAVGQGLWKLASSLGKEERYQGRRERRKINQPIEGRAPPTPYCRICETDVQP